MKKTLADIKFFKEECINRIESMDKFFLESLCVDDCFGNGEKYLTFDYGRNWREKIRIAGTKEEVEFLENMVWKLRRNIIIYYGESKKNNDIDFFQLVRMSEKELNDLSFEEGNNRKEKRKMSERDIKGVIDGLEKVLKGEADEYKNFSCEQLINKIAFLKVEIKKLGSMKNSGNLQAINIKETFLKTQLQKAVSVLNNLQNPNNFPKSAIFLPIIGIVGLVSLFAGLIIGKRTNEPIKPNRPYDFLKKSKEYRENRKD